MTTTQQADLRQMLAAAIHGSWMVEPCKHGVPDLPGYIECEQFADRLLATPSGQAIQARLEAAEGTHLVLFSDALMQALAGEGRVEWNEPDENGWYVPTVYADPRIAELQARLEAAEARAAHLEGFLTWLSTYEKDPPEVMKDDWAYDRFLNFIHEQAAAALASGSRPEGEAQ